MFKITKTLFVLIFVFTFSFSSAQAFNFFSLESYRALFLAAVSTPKLSDFTITGGCNATATITLPALSVTGYEIQRKDGKKFVTIATVGKGINTYKETHPIPSIISAEYRVRSFTTTINKPPKSNTIKYSAYTKSKFVSFLPSTHRSCQTLITATPFKESDITLETKKGSCVVSVFAIKPEGAHAELKYYRYSVNNILQSTPKIMSFGITNKSSDYLQKPGTYIYTFETIGKTDGYPTYSTKTTKSITLSTENCSTNTNSVTPAIPQTPSAPPTIGEGNRVCPYGPNQIPGCPPDGIGGGGIDLSSKGQWYDITNDLSFKDISKKITTLEGIDITKNIFGISNSDHKYIFAIYENSQRKFLMIQVLDAEKYVSKNNGKPTTSVIFDPAKGSYVRSVLKQSVPISMSEQDSLKIKKITTNSNFSLCLPDLFGCSSYNFKTSFVDRLKVVVKNTLFNSVRAEPLVSPSPGTVPKVVEPKSPKEMLETKYFDLEDGYPYEDQYGTIWDSVYVKKINNVWACGLIFKTKNSDRWIGLDKISVDEKCSPGSYLVEYFSSFYKPSDDGLFGSFVVTPEWSVNGIEGYFAGFVGSFSGKEGW